MPNIFSCDPGWLEKLKKGQDKVVIATWKEGSPGVDRYLESLQQLEDQGIPVFVVDATSCPKIADSLNTKESGETVVFSKGKEVGRLTPGGNPSDDLAKVKDMANGKGGRDGIS